MFCRERERLSEPVIVDVPRHLDRAWPPACSIKGDMSHHPARWADERRRVKAVRQS